MWIRCRTVWYVSTNVSEEFNYLHLHCGRGSGCYIQIVFNSSIKEYDISFQKTIILILTAMNISVSHCFICVICVSRIVQKQ